MLAAQVVAYNTTVGVQTRATSDDPSTLLDLTPGLVLLAFIPRNARVASGVAAAEPLLHFETLTDLCGIHPTNADSLVLLRLMHDPASTSALLDPAISYWLKSAAPLINASSAPLMASFDRYATLLPRAVLVQFAGWNLRFCTVGEYGLGGGGDAVAAQAMVEMFLEPPPAACPAVYEEAMRTLLQFTQNRALQEGESSLEDLGPGGVQGSVMSALIIYIRAQWGLSVNVQVTRIQRTTNQGYDSYMVSTDIAFSSWSSVWDLVRIPIDGFTGSTC